MSQFERVAPNKKLILGGLTLFFCLLFSFTFADNPPQGNHFPVLGPIGNKEVAAGSLFTFTLTATDLDVSDTLEFYAIGLPIGASLNKDTGVFSWIPTKAQIGTQIVIFGVSDGRVRSEEAVIIEVKGATLNHPPSLTNPGNKSVVGGSLLQFTLSATDQDAGDILTFTMQNAPAGVTLNSSTGVFKWTPDYTAVGQYNITFTVSDGSLTDSESIIISVIGVKYILRVSASGDGLVNPTIGSYEPHTNVSITATPKSGNIFVSWSGDVPDAKIRDNPLVLTMDSDKNVAANFALQNQVPSITAQPQSKTITLGSGVTFSVTATGAAPLTYQWQKKSFPGAFTDISGATSASYTFTPIARDNGAQFRCTVTNSAGSVTSNTADLAVNVTLTINAKNGIVNRSSQGTQVTGGYAYPAGIVLTLTATPNTGYSFSNWSGDVTGSVNPASITLNDNKTVTANFISQAQSPTAPSNLTATTLSTTEIRLYWQDNSNNETGFKIESSSAEAGPFTQIGVMGVGAITCRNFNLTPNTTYYYRVRAYNAAGNSDYTNVISATTASNVTTPTITTQPSNKTVLLGNNVTFTIAATGTASLTYQWQKKAPAAAAFSNISGATSASYTFTTLASDNGAQFKCTVTNSAGSVTSNAATLTVNVTLTINAQNGTVNRSTQGTQVTGGYIYPAGIVLTFTATPNTGYSFTSWSGDLTGSVNPASITLNANKTVTANFISQAPEIPITVGQSVTGAIHAVGEKNHYAFNANANDTVTIRAVTTYNSLQCYLELYGPDGGKLDENRSQIDKTLPASGKYTILLRDFNNLFTGNYCLIYGIINNNSWAPTIVAGQTINGTISANDRIKFYQFSANINDTVTFHTVAIYDILLCYLELYGPGGEKLDENRNQIDKTLPASGRYTILLRDFNSLHTGDYKLTYTRNNSAPIADSLIPSSGSSQADSQVFFTANYSDSDGFSDMGEIYLLVNGATDGANCFYAYYNPYLDQLYLRNDVNTTWLGGFSPSTPTTIENSYAALNCGKTEINKSGNSVTVKWSVSFKGAFSGHDYNIYLLVKDRVGATSGWLKMGVWRVDPRTGPINIVSFTPFDKSRFLEGTTIGCSARAEPSGDTYEYQFLIDGTVKKQFSPDNKWDWQVVPQDKGIHALTIKVRNQYGTTTEDSHRLIVYRRPVDPQ